MPSRSSSSLTLYDQMRELDHPNVKKTDWGRIFGYVWKMLVLAILITVLYLTIYTVQLKKNENAVQVDGLICYHCSSNANVTSNPEYPPYSPNCLNKPVTTKRCQIGNLCQSTIVQVRKFKRVIRSCSIVSTKLGYTQNKYSITYTCDHNQCNFQANA